MGARIAGKLFGDKGFKLVAGHDNYSGYDSPLRKPDKYSWLLAPRWWLWLNLWVEPKIKTNGMGRWEHVNSFKEQVRKNIESGEYHSTHDIYLKQNER